MKFSRTHSQNYEAGYTLLFAVLLTSIVLAVGLSILNISRKESLLASGARESQLAIYAADAGIECATYYTYNPSVNGAVFLTPDITTGYDPNAPAAPSAPAAVEFACNNQNLLPATQGTRMTDAAPNNQAAYKYTFYLNLSQGNETACAKVDVLSGWIYNEAATDTADPENYVPHTRIESRGYNAGWNGTTCDGTSVKKVERAIRVSI